MPRKTIPWKLEVYGPGGALSEKDVDDLAAEIEAIPIPVIHIPVVWDVPPLPGGTSGGGGSSTPGPATPSSGGTTYNNVNVNLSTAAGLPGTLSMISNMAR